MAKVKQHWVKTTPFGDYRMTEDRVNARKNRDIHIIRKARALGLIGKHAGSKPIGRLVKSIRTFEIGIKLYEDYKKAMAA
jgi:hypothetical protein